MPEEDVLERARKDKEEGKSPSTQAGEFVKEEIDHVREGKHGARSAKQAIAIGLSKARRAGVDLPVPKKGSVSEKVRRDAMRSRGKRGTRKHSAKRSRATSNALRRESRSSVSHEALAKQARASAAKRGSAGRHQGGEKAVRTRRGSSEHRS